MEELPPSHLPQYIFLENVKGFEHSNTRDMIVSFLESHKFYFQEYLLNSRQFNIPNSRLRYYLAARRTASFSGGNDHSGVLTELPFEDSILPPCPSLSVFLTEEENTSEYTIPDEYLTKWGKLLDIVTPDSNRSCCFTKGYSVKAEGSGSVLQQSYSQHDASLNSLDTNNNVFSNDPLTGPQFLSHMKSLSLRYFTPREIARIHGIPDSFMFPQQLSRKQLYRVLGNGLNVTVIQYLLKYVLFNDNM